MSRLLVTLSWGLAGVAIAGALTVPDWMAGFVVDVPASAGKPVCGTDFKTVSGVVGVSSRPRHCRTSGALAF